MKQYRYRIEKAAVGWRYTIEYSVTVTNVSVWVCREPKWRLSEKACKSSAETSIRIALYDDQKAADRARNDEMGVGCYTYDYPSDSFKEVKQ